MRAFYIFIILLYALSEFLTWRYQFQVNAKVFEFEQMLVRDNFKNEVTYHGTTYKLYGLQGEGFVKKAYEIYSPVYMAESTESMLRQEEYSDLHTQTRR